MGLLIGARSSECNNSPNENITYSARECQHLDSASGMRRPGQVLSVTWPDPKQSLKQIWKSDLLVTESQISRAGNRPLYRRSQFLPNPPRSTISNLLLELQPCRAAYP